MRLFLVGLRYFLGWLIFFIASRGLFLLYHSKKSSQLDTETLLCTFIKGIKLDLSFSAYLSVLPFLLLTFGFMKLNSKWLVYLLSAYHLIITFLISILITADLELYEAWHFRIDPTPFRYMDNPTEVWASAWSSPLLLLLSCVVLIAATLWITFKQLIIKPLRNFISSFHLVYFTLGLFLTACLAVPIRGGFQLSPINQSSVYFSNIAFANHAAINAPWNFFGALVNNTYQTENPYQYVSKTEASQLLDTLYKRKNNMPNFLSVNPKKATNVLIIVWESLTAKVVERLGGVKNVTPNFDRLSHEGLFFSNMYASGDRSDKGLVAILSGYPAQPLGSIMTIPNKTQKLPSLSREFIQKGYRTAFYYGGEPEFANIKSYLLSSGYQRLITKNDFQEKDWNSKWGAHDGVVYDRLLNDLRQEKKPFFYTFFTLSSHEPFEVPLRPVFKGDEKTDGFLNSHRYADACFGKFIEAAKQEKWWDNTLIIVIADHGHPLPETNSEFDRYQIPMLWLGGVLNKRDTVISTIASQTDVASTLLHQLDTSSQLFKWSDNILNINKLPFAYFIINDGFGWVDITGKVLYDQGGKRVMEQTGKDMPMRLRQAKAYAQTSYQDFLDK